MVGSRTKRPPNEAPIDGLEHTLDVELADLPPELRWREWMARIEAVIFASTEPVCRDVLRRVVGADASIDLLIDDLREELRSRPYDLVNVAGGWQHRTRRVYAEAIRTAAGVARGQAGDDRPGIRPLGPRPLSQVESLALICIAYYQPITRTELGAIFGKEVSRDIMSYLRSLRLIASGPRSPQPGAPYTYVTTDLFLSQFGLNTLRDLPDLEALEDAGLLSKAQLIADSFFDEPSALEADEELRSR